MQGGGGGGGGGDNGKGVAMRKGPWMAEEDEILIEYVGKYGPRDWSSIRSKGLLPRTGKSCRLRWVNKLKPDLKTGCKFSPEEEKIVIDLQARFGNKWARIATYLTGRTDNDVKNFWSTRQKRLARILQTPLPPKSSKTHGKAPISHEITINCPRLDLIPFGEESCNQCSKTSYTDSSDSTNLMQMPDMLSQDLLHMDTTLPLLEPSLETKPCISTVPLLSAPLSNQLSQPLLDLPFLPEGTTDLVPVFSDLSLPDELARQENSQCMQFLDGLPLYGPGLGQHGAKREDGNSCMPECFFEDLPADMFDYLDPPPASSSSAW